MDAEDLEDLFRPLGRVTTKRMFSGRGIYADDVIFALDINGEVFLKTDEQTRPLFEAAGLRPFSYEAPRGTVSTSYWLLPPAAYDDEAELLKWGRLGLEAGRRFAAKKPAIKKKAAAKRSPRAKPAR